MNADDAVWILAAFALYGVALSIAYWLRWRARQITITSPYHQGIKPGMVVQCSDMRAKVIAVNGTTLTCRRIAEAAR